MDQPIHRHADSTHLGHTADRVEWRRVLRRRADHTEGDELRRWRDGVPGVEVLLAKLLVPDLAEAGALGLAVLAFFLCLHALAVAGDCILRRDAQASYIGQVDAIGIGAADISEGQVSDIPVVEI